MGRPALPLKVLSSSAVNSFCGAAGGGGSSSGELQAGRGVKDEWRTTLCKLLFRATTLRVARMFNPNLKFFDTTEHQTPHPWQLAR